MSEKIRKRVIAEADYMIENKCTLREISDKFRLSLSSVHLDLAYRLLVIDEEKWHKVRSIIENNALENATRFTNRTRKSYQEFERD